MSNKFKDLVLIGILICLLIIALKPVPQMNITQPHQLTPGQSVVQLGQNRIAIVETSNNSGMYGSILVFDYDEQSRAFKLQGKYDYSDYFRNPQIQKPLMPSIP